MADIPQTLHTQRKVQQFKLISALKCILVTFLSQNNCQLNLGFGGLIMSLGQVSFGGHPKRGPKIVSFVLSQTAMVAIRVELVLCVFAPAQNRPHKTGILGHTHTCPSCHIPCRNTNVPPPLLPAGLHSHCSSLTVPEHA